MNIDRSTSCLDPEDLAAFIDRRLPAEERRRVEEHLVECSDCYDVFVDTVKFLEEEADAADREAEGGGRVRRGPWWGQRSLRVALPLAATVVLVAGLWGWLGGGSAVPAPAELIAGIDASALPVGRVESLVEGQGWPRTRGGQGRSGGSVGAPVPPHVAFQLGALTTDLALALDRPDLAEGVAPRLVGHIEAVLKDEVDLSEPLTQSYRTLAEHVESGEPAALVREEAAEIARTVESAVGSAPFRLGAWAEAGRLAAAAGAVEPLRRGAVHKAAKGLDRDALPERLDDAVEDALRHTGSKVEEANLPGAEDSFRILVSLGGRDWPTG